MWALKEPSLLKMAFDVEILSIYASTSRTMVTIPPADKELSAV